MDFVWVALLIKALHAVGKQMVADAVLLLVNLGDVFSIGDKGYRS
jgi:hypothetical protein